jgi:hypothetical protein
MLKQTCEILIFVGIVEKFLDPSFLIWIAIRLAYTFANHQQ